MVRSYGPCAPYPTIAVMIRGPRSRAGLTAYPARGHHISWADWFISMRLLRDLPVCIPNAAPIPKMTMKMTKGTRLGCNPLLRLSEMANTTKTRMKVPMNWSGRWEMGLVQCRDLVWKRRRLALTSSKKQLADDM